MTIVRSECHWRTIVMSDSAGLINEHSDYRVAVRTADFSMNQFQTVVDRTCSAISRTRSATDLESMTRWRKLSICAYCAQKKKWAKTHRTTHPTIRVSCGFIRERSGGSKRRSTAQIGN